MTKPYLRLFILAFLFIAGSRNGIFAQSIGGTPLGFKFAPDKFLSAVIMPGFNVDSLLQEDAIDNAFKDRPYRFGYNHMVNYDLNSSGKWTSIPGGGRVWQLDVKCPGAYTINLAFKNFNLPDGAKLFVYSKDHKEILGAFTSKNNLADKLFGTEFIYKDEVVIEYYEPAAVIGKGTFTLFRITHGYKDFKPYLKDLGDAGSCMNNVNCPQYADFYNQKRGVVILVTRGSGFCSGSLVSDVPQDGTPYILTANHCDTADGSWVFWFHWEATGCADPDVAPTYQAINGGTTVAHNSTSDFNLVLMSSTPPANYNVFYEGWSRSTTPATSVTCIHHPEGDITKCSRSNNPVSDFVYDAGNGPAQVWKIGLWTDGCTEPGSSGSPLFDQNKRVVGQLYGGPSDCGEPDSLLWDTYGRFCLSWDTGGTPPTELKEWLDPGNTNTMTTDGYDPNVTQSLDVAIAQLISPQPISYCTLNPVIEVVNHGTTTLTSFTVNYNVDGGSSSSYTWNGSLASLQLVQVPLTIATPAAGNHTFYVAVSAPNGSADQNISNDSTQGQFTVIVPSPASIPFNEGFESNTFPPSGWAVTSPPDGVSWQLNVGAGGFGQSNQSAIVNQYSAGVNTSGDRDDLISPFINFASATAPVYLNFDVAYAPYDSSHFDSLGVFVSTDCGATWNEIYIKGNNDLETAPVQADSFVPSGSQWRTESVNVSNLVGSPQVQFDFQFISGWGNILYLDNVNISGTASIVDADNIAWSVYPNPFNDFVTIKLNLSVAQSVTAGIYSIDGKLVQTVLNNQLIDAGPHQFEVNTANLSSAMYFLKLNNQFIKLERMK